MRKRNPHSTTGRKAKTFWAGRLSEQTDANDLRATYDTNTMNQRTIDALIQHASTINGYGECNSCFRRHHVLPYRHIKSFGHIQELSLSNRDLDLTHNISICRLNKTSDHQALPSPSRHYLHRTRTRRYQQGHRQYSHDGTSPCGLSGCHRYKYSAVYEGKVAAMDPTFVVFAECSALSLVVLWALHSLSCRQ